jgi:hypothetical protein
MSSHLQPVATRSRSGGGVLRHHLLLVSRHAMHEEASVLAAALARGGGRVTLLLAGECMSDSPDGYQALPDGVAVQREMAAVAVAPRGLWRAGPLRTLVLWAGIQRKRQAARHRLKELQPDVLLVFEDRILDPEAIWLVAARDVGVPSMLIRYASSSVESDAWTRQQRPGYSLNHGLMAWGRRAFARRYPHHALDRGAGAQLFYPLWYSCALALAGMADTHPWVAGGGAVARATVQGLIDHREAVEVTGLTARFVISGQPSWDLLAACPERPPGGGARLRLVCAWPQWAEHSQLPWPVHMDRLGRLAANLGASGAEVILCLHPKAERSRYAELAQRHGLVISDRPLSEELPRADLFVASWSSTLRWAAMLGVAAVNLDWAGQNYDLFEGLKSLPTSVAPEDLAPLLAELLDRPEKRVSLGRALREESAVYGIIDGQVCARIQRLIELVVESTSECLHE